MKLFLLMGVGLLSGTAALAQTDNKYLDDAYYRRSDLKKIDKEERRKAELRRAAEKAEREAWERNRLHSSPTTRRSRPIVRSMHTMGTSPCPKTPSR